MKKRAPWWFIVINVAVALPLMTLAGAAREVLSASPQSLDLGWLFPVYAVASAALAVASYPQRRSVAWILWSLMVLAALMLLIVSNYGH